MLFINKNIKLGEGWILSIIASILPCLFLFLLYIALEKYDFNEVEPPILPFVAEKDVKFSETPSPVDIGLYVESFPVFDIDSGLFRLTGSLWFSYRPSQVSLTTLENFKVEGGTVIERSAPRSKMIKDHIFVVYNVKLDFNADLNHRLFPLADHKIFLTLKFPDASSKEIALVSSNSKIVVRENLSPRGWNVIDFKVHTGFSKEVFDPQDSYKYVENPQVNFGLFCSQPGFRKILIVIIPAFLMFLICTLSLLIKTGPTDRVGVSMTIAAITGILVHRFVVETLSPKVGYFTLSDHLFVIFLSSAFFSLVLHMIQHDGPFYWYFKVGAAYFMNILLLSYFYYFCFM